MDINPAATNPIQDVYPLSSMQEGLLFHYLLDESADHYIIQFSYHLAGELNVGFFERCLHEIVHRYDILRTIFLYTGYERPLQVVLRSRAGAFTYEDIRKEVMETGRTISVEKCRQLERKQKFKLNEDNLLRVRLYRTGEEDYEFIWSFHHILMDGWCMGILVNEFNTFYQACQAGMEPLLPEVQPYSAYITWLEQRDKEGSLNYWRNYLSGYNRLAIAGSIPPSGKNGYHLASSHLILDKQLTALLHQIGGKYGVTLNTILQTAWGILLSRCNNVNDVVFGAVVSGRPSELSGVEQMVGLFINTIPVRIRFEEEETPIRLLRHVQERAMEAEQHHYSPLAEIQSGSGLNRLFDHILVFENYPTAERVEGVTAQYRVTDVKIFERTSYDLSLIITPGEEIDIEFSYNSNRYDPGVIAGLCRHLDTIIRQIGEGIDLPVSRIEMLTAEERGELLYTFNNTAAEYPRNKTIIDLFGEQAEKTPGNVAVKGEGFSITYQELKDRSDRMANYLRQEAGVGVGDLVGLLLDREEELLPSIFGIMKSGAAYVPLSPYYPSARINSIISDAGLKAVITRERYIDALSVEMASGLVDLDSSLERIKKLPAGAPDQGPGGHDLAYVIYTSGSTGKPKGVMIEHHSVVNRLLWMQKTYVLTEKDVLLQKTPLVFDVSIWELFWCSFTGASLCLLPPGEEKDPKVIISGIEKNGVTTIHFVPSMLSVFLDVVQAGADGDLSPLRKVFASGEALSADQVNRFSRIVYDRYGTRLINLYGPTEATVDVSYYECDLTRKNEIIPIGKPSNNVQLYILDKKLRLSPLGVAGELCIGGVGVARGYLHDADLTKEKFVTVLFDKEERVYRTGDLARWMPDGNIQYLGRMDDQVKIRGYRIELGEIESRLMSHPAVKEAVVLAHEREDLKYLVAYYVSVEKLSPAELRGHLSAHLPDYMLPANYVPVDSIPVNSNEKTDRKALAGLKFNGEADYVAPGNAVEEKLVEIWSDILKLDRKAISVNKSYTELGGDSIKAIKVIDRISQQFNINFKMAEFYSRNQLRDLADHISMMKQIQVAHNQLDEIVEIKL